MKITAQMVRRSIYDGTDIVLPNIDNPLVFISAREVFDTFDQCGFFATAAVQLTDANPILSSII